MGKNYILENGLIAKFNLKEFRTMVHRTLCSNRRNGLKATKEEIFFDIAEKYNLSADSVKRWHKGNGSPQDIEKVENLADYFGISTEDLLLFDDSDITTISESKKEQTEMTIDNNVYEADPRLVIKRNEIPVQAEVRWFVRDVYIDLYKYISDYLYYDQYVETDRVSENRQDPGYPLFYVRQKINQYRMDLPEEAVDNLNKLADYLERIPFYKEIVNISSDFDDGTSFEEIKEFYDEYLDLDEYFSLVMEENVNIFSEENEERYKLVRLIDDYYKKVQEDFFSMSKSVLGKYFE